MNVLHLASANRWTGAAAPAFAEVEALRSIGIDSHYGYVGGYKLEQKIGAVPFAHPMIARKQSPVAFLHSTRLLRDFIRERAIDIVHAHLTYDHFLAWSILPKTRARLVRTFHSRHTLRNDPFTRMLLRRTAAVAVVNATFLDSTTLLSFAPRFTPPPVDHRLFQPRGEDVRDRYGLHASDRVLCAIGKLAPGRGFEEVLEVTARLAADAADVRLMIIGVGPHKPLLEEHAASLGIAGRVVWAGYHEDDLAEHYRAADLLLFTAAGSDEGHRAITEAMACGVPVAAYPIPGVSPLVGELASRLIAQDSSVASLAAVAGSLLRSDRDRLRSEVVEESRRFAFPAAAMRLKLLYQNVARKA
jgi:glycosyltransferase involved in cell wall biosynthesis